MSDELELPEKYQGRDDAEELKEQYKQMLFEPGEAAGVVGAQSLSEPATQMTMETYHSAGAAKVSITLGLPRLIEIIDARKNPKTPIMDIYLEEDYQDEDAAREVATELQTVTLQDIVAEDSLDIAQMELEFVLDEDVLDEFLIDKQDVQEKLDSKLKKTTVSLTDGTLRMAPDTEDYDLTDLQDIRKKAADIRLKGIKGIEHVVLMEEDGEWRIQTAGVNLRKVLKIDGVDASRTTCNDFFEILSVLGVEAARNMVLRELQSTLEEQGINVDIRWLMMLADTMTKDGDIKGATRYGIVGSKHSVLARSSFEETKKHLTNAALHGEVDPISSVVENLILGQVIPVGTGQLELTAEPGKAEPIEDPTVPLEQPEPEIPEGADEEAEPAEAQELTAEDLQDKEDFERFYDEDEELYITPVEGKEYKTNSRYLHDQVRDELGIAEDADDEETEEEPVEQTEQA